MSTTIVYAVCAAGALAVGAGLGALFAVRSRARARWLAPVILAVVALALNHLVVAPAAMQASGGKGAGGGAEKIVGLVREQAPLRPAVAYFLGAQESSGKTSEQTLAEFSELAARGTVRLDPAQLVRRARLIDAALSKLDERTCAIVAFDASSPVAIQGPMPAFTDADLREWVALAAAAADRELTKAAERPRLTEEQVAAVMAEIQSREAEVAALAAKAQGANPADADRCAFAKRLYGQVRTLSGRQLLELARLLGAPPK